MMSRGLLSTIQQVLLHVAWLVAVLAGLNGPVVDAQATPDTLDAFRVDLVAAFGGGGPDMRDLVRLGFHDCTSDACDGCIDLTDVNNAGLVDAVNTLDPLCETHSIALADCYATAASYAVEETSGTASMPLLFGRTNSDTCVGGGSFPDGEDGVATTFGYFDTTFGFTERETVAIMGAHSLGVAELATSGFEGAWTANPNQLDNAFYSDMLVAGWVTEENDAGQWQWDSNGRLMLNSDMSMIMDPFDGTDASGEPTCTYANCPASPTLSIAEEFAADNDLFIAEFSAAFVKMLVKGYDMCSLEVTNPGTIVPDGCGITVADDAELTLGNDEPVATGEPVRGAAGMGAGGN